jgi:hypothetical protein
MKSSHSFAPAAGLACAYFILSLLPSFFKQPPLANFIHAISQAGD